ncbi:hypothetical protein ASwh1_38 [Aeromonas phage Aswh_1]|nr:hypothetical protein ASwh1_38 [Aeromonas phage Aswh_1]
MTDLMVMRLWWAVGITTMGLILPIIIALIATISYKDRFKWYYKCMLVGWMCMFFVFGRDMIPTKYDIVEKKVYQCSWVTEYHPKYPQQ